MQSHAHAHTLYLSNSFPVSAYITAVSGDIVTRGAVTGNTITAVTGDIVTRDAVTQVVRLHVMLLRDIN